MAAWDDDAPIEYADVDADYDPQSDNPLVQPGSDGLVTAGGPQMLMELARRREQGASLDACRRDAGQIEHIRVSNAMLERAIEQGRRLNDYARTGRITERRRYWGGISLPKRPAHEGAPPDDSVRNSSHNDP